MDNHAQTRWHQRGGLDFSRGKKEVKSHANTDAYFQVTLTEMRNDMNESKVISSKRSGILRGSPLQSTRNRKRKSTFGVVHCQTIVALVTKFLLEHDGELFESLFGHASRIAGLDLLFQIVFHAHGQLIQLIPLLGKIHCAVFRVSISTTHHMLIM